MKILSLFDGISCARVALERAGIPVEQYYASEIDRYAIQISQKNWPEIIQMGDVKEIARATKHTKLYYNNLDLLIGGSPCQDLSIAKKNREGLKGDRSGLFYEYVRIRDEVKPKYFILENVASMPKEAKEQISEILGVQPVMINASLVSAQNRKRLFWVGKRNSRGGYDQIEIPQPEDKGILLKDILESGEADRLKSYCIDASYYKGANWKQYKEKGRRQLIKIGAIGGGGQGQRVYDPKGKSVALSALGGGQGAKTGLYAVALRNRGQGKKPEIGGNKANAMTTVQTDSMVMENMQIRKLTPIECERLQGLPDNYTKQGFEMITVNGSQTYWIPEISNTQRYKALGNAFNVDVVAHILKQVFKGKC